MKVTILDLHVGHVGGEVQKNILSVLLWAPANVGVKHCLVCPERLVASQEYFLLTNKRSNCLLIFNNLKLQLQHCSWLLKNNFCHVFRLALRATRYPNMADMHLFAGCEKG